MAFTSIGYDGTVNERQWAELVPSVGSSTYGVKGAGDLKVTAVPGQPLMVQVAAGTGWGHGVLDTEASNTTIACDTINSGSRWDLIALRRDWQPLAGGPTAVAKVTGTSEKAIPGSRKNQPGVIDDQPLALVQWTAGQTQPTAIIDLRCWSGSGGVVAADPLALTYLDRVGSSVTIAAQRWDRVVGANDTVSWVASNETGKIPAFGVGSTLAGGIPAAGVNFLVQAGTVAQSTDASGNSRITWPKPFPNGLLTVVASNGDAFSSGPGVVFSSAGGSFWGSAGAGDRAEWVYTMSNSSGILGGKPHRINYVAIGW